MFFQLVIIQKLTNFYFLSRLNHQERGVPWETNLKMRKL